MTLGLLELLEGLGIVERLGRYLDAGGLGKVVSDKDPAKAARVMQAMMKMVKLDIPTLERAYNGD